MKERYVDHHFEYKGYGVHESFCMVEVWEHKGKYLVVLTEPGTESSGTSVTNACETIATDLFKKPGVFKHNTKSSDIIWIEHYSERGEFPETFDLIELTEHGDGEFVAPDWRHIGETLSDEKKLELLNALA